MTPTPAATKVALVVTLVLTVVSLVVFLTSAEHPIDPGHAAPFLWLYSALFLCRVAGQLVARRLRPSWLPPTEHWNLSPYHLLLPTQVVILAVMTWIDASFSAEDGPPVSPRPAMGWLVLVFAGVYAASMVLRYAIRMTRQPEQRWFGGTIPIVFHVVLAAYLTVFGAYHASY